MTVNKMHTIHQPKAHVVVISLPLALCCLLAELLLLLLAAVAHQRVRLLQQRFDSTPTATYNSNS